MKIEEVRGDQGNAPHLKKRRRGERMQEINYYQS
jgi:hypothetical protein